MSSNIHATVGIEFDPHQNKPGNLVPDEPVVVTGTKYRMLIPAHAPFYTNSVVVKSNGAELKLGTDYIVTHQYITGVHRTGRVIQGMIWLLNPQYVDRFTVTYHAVGIGEATAQQIAAEREANKNVYPHLCQWDQVIGEVYFPPVDIQFDRAGWQGELELMRAIAGTIAKPDAFLGNDTYWKGPLWPYTEDSSKNYAYISENIYGPKAPGPWGLFRPFWRCLPSTKLAYTVNGFKGYDTTLPSVQIKSYSSADNYGSPNQTDQVSLNFQIVCGPASAPTYTLVVTCLNEQSNDVYSERIALPVIREDATISALVQMGTNNIFFILTINDEDSRTAMITGMTSNNASFQSWFTKITNPAYRLVGINGDFNQVSRIEFITVPNQRTDLGDVYEVIKHWKDIVNSLFTDSPARAHVANRNNPHAATYGPSRAIERNGIASDSTLAFGKTEPVLADYINQQHPQQADLLLKILRAGEAARQMTGPFVTHPGITSFATTADPVALSKYMGRYLDHWSEKISNKSVVYLGKNKYRGDTNNGISATCAMIPIVDQNVRISVSGVYRKGRNNAVGNVGATWYQTAGATTGKYVRVRVDLYSDVVMYNISCYNFGGGAIPEHRLVNVNVGADFTDGEAFTFELSLVRTGNKIVGTIVTPKRTLTAPIDLDAPTGELATFLTNQGIIPWMKRPEAENFTFASGALDTTVELKAFPGLAASWDGDASQFQVDPKVLRFLGLSSTRIGAVNADSRIKAGNNVLLLTKAGVLTWNGKQLLDPTTVGPFLPGNSGGGDGLFYGTNTTTVTINGNGIKNVPFVCRFTPPDNTDTSIPAMRMLTNDFGTSESLAATPALVNKLAAEFTGKLELAKAWVNTIPLSGSITIDRFVFGLSDVQNIPDSEMPVSTAQAAKFDEYAHVGHTHPASAFGIGQATDTVLGVVKYGGLVDDSTLALDGSNVIKQADTLARLKEELNGMESNVTINIIRYGNPGTRDSDVGTFSAFMITLAKNKYFVRREYQVPAKSFNLLELFPNRYLNASFDIFVDLVGDVASYVVALSGTMSENMTRTLIGNAETSDTAITTLRVRNTTRLGDFYELMEHRKDVSAHFTKERKMWDYRAIFPENAPVYTSGTWDFQRGVADWRARGPYDWADMAGINYDGEKVVFSSTGINFNSNEWRSYINIKPQKKLRQTTVNWSVAPNDSMGTILESIFLGYCTKKGVYNRISILISRRQLFVDGSGNFCHVALGVNFGMMNYVAIGIPDSAFTGVAPGWDVLAPKVIGQFYSNFEGVYEGSFYVKLGTNEHTFGVYLSKDKKTLKLQHGMDPEIEVDISSRFPPGFIDLDELFDGTKPMLYTGLGGVFDSTAAATIVPSASTPMTEACMGTAIDYFNNYSPMSRFQYRTNDVNLGSNVWIDNVRSQFIISDFAERSLYPDMIPTAMTRQSMFVYSRASRAAPYNFCYQFKF